MLVIVDQIGTDRKSESHIGVVLQHEFTVIFIGISVVMIQEIRPDFDISELVGQRGY